MRTDTSYATPGATVAVYDRRTIDGPWATVHTVARVTTTQIVLDNGTRWRRTDGKPVGYQDASGFHGPPTLQPVNEPKVIGALARGAVLTAVERIKGVYGGGDRIQGLNTAASALADIEAATEKLRADLGRLWHLTANAEEPQP